jgi:subtilisin-like proprotein convertase family protein
MATLSLQASPPEGGTASGSGTYPVGSHCTIQAAANPGWYFGIWQDGVADNPRQVVVPAVGAKFTAYFSNAIPQIVVQPADLAVEVGQPAVFSVTAAQHAGPPYVFYWHKQEKMAAVFSADTESSFVLTNAQVADAGQYYVVISNSLAVSASTNSRVASLQVTNPSAGQLVQFSNSAPILIHDAAPAQPYPSIITIAGQQGPIQSATVSLNALAHVWPHDIGVLLVGPQGQEVVLMANAGGGQVLTGVTLTFDDAAATVLSEESPILAGCYRPSACGASEVFPSPAPAGPYAAALTTLNGADPNGNWSLYVHDDQPGDSGQIAQGWTLSLGLKSSAPDSRPVVRQPRLDVDGHFTFELAGASGTNYEVRVSSDLKNWKVLSTISLVGSKTNVVDPNPPLQQRYYRVRRVPE